MNTDELSRQEQRINALYQRAYRLLIVSVIGWIAILTAGAAQLFLACDATNSTIEERLGVLVATKEIRIEGKEPAKTIITPGTVMVIDAYGTKAALNSAGLKYYDKNGVEIIKTEIPHIDLPKK